MNRGIIGITIGFLASMACVHAASNTLDSAKVVAFEAEAQKIAQSFTSLNNQINIASVSDSIVSNNAVMLKKALEDIINLNRIITSQLNLVIQSWNQYLDVAKSSTPESYLLGQVMSSCITALRSLSLRSNVDQAMILSLVKKNFSSESNNQQVVDAHKTQVAAKPAVQTQPTVAQVAQPVVRPVVTPVARLTQEVRPVAQVSQQNSFRL